MDTTCQRTSARIVAAGVTGLVVIVLFAMLPGLTAAGNISATHRHAWSERAGWLNFRPDGGGVTVYPDHLEGSVWAENFGWLKVGSYSGGGAHTYANTSNTNWGVNHDGSGQLSGYAWSETVGWLNFDSSEGQVTIDPATGEFDGFAWAENVGWIHVGNPDSGYLLATVPVLTVDDVTADEAVGNMTFRVSLSEAIPQIVSITYATANGTATAENDYSSATGTSAITAGSDYTEIVVPIIDDTGDEPDETFMLAVSHPANIGVGDFQGVGTIIDNDASPALAIADATAAEKTQKMVFSVTLSPVSARDVSVEYSTHDGSGDGMATVGQDYTATGGTLTIPAGNSSGTIEVTILTDSKNEGDETFFVALSNPVNAALIDDQGTGTIQDGNGTPGGSDHPGEIPEPSTYVLFMLGLLSIAWHKRRR